MKMLAMAALTALPGDFKMMTLDYMAFSKNVSRHTYIFEPLVYQR